MTKTTETTDLLADLQVGQFVRMRDGSNLVELDRPHAIQDVIHATRTMVELSSRSYYYRRNGTQVGNRQGIGIARAATSEEVQQWRFSMAQRSQEQLALARERRVRGELKSQLAALFPEAFVRETEFGAQGTLDLVLQGLTPDGIRAIANRLDGFWQSKKIN